MPGPGSKKSKSKTKPAIQKSEPKSKPVPYEYIGQIDNAEGWYLVIDELCKIYKVPDLTTRSGLKKVHANFDVLYRRLDDAYEAHQDNDKFTGGIIGIYAKMCADVLLRNKLFAKGFLRRMLPLLRQEITRHLVLRALSSITHSSGEQVRIEIAREANFLAKSLLDFPDDHIGSELAVAVLSHSLSCIVLYEHQSIAPEVFASLDMPLIVKAVVTACQRPTASPYTIDHGNELLAMATLHCTAAFHSNPSAISLLVAGLRSKDWTFRCTCLGGLIRLHRKNAEDDTRVMDPNKLMDSVERGFPPHISEILMNYGIKICETTVTVQTSVEFTKAIMACAQDHDLYRLGLTIADCILRTEFSVPQGMFQSQNPRTGEMETVDVGLPFMRWDDSLPHCASAIRARGKPSEMDKADILDIKYRIMKGQLSSAFDMARRSLVRNPHCAYYQYALSLSADAELGLKSSKKGLKCRETSPFLRFQLMQRAVEHAGELGISKLQDVSAHGDRAWQEGTAFLMSALEDSRIFIQHAPPDNRHLKRVLYWNILLRLATEGPELSLELSELQRVRRQLKLADEIGTYVGMPPPNTYLRQTQNTVLKLYAEASREWGDTISRRDAQSETVEDVESYDDGDDHDHEPGHRHRRSHDLDEEIAAWVDGLRLDDAEKPCKPHRLHPKINSNHVELYRCSWCSNPSAILKKCSGCAATRYCDAGCQKSHWAEHKKQCKK